MREIDEVVQHWRAAQAGGRAAALASVVHVDGSSYRKPGARMLVTDAGPVAGAVSGGCVERAVAAVARGVLATGTPEMMVYDGRYRLGCEGTLHILVEPFAPAEPDAFYAAFAKTRDARTRQAFSISSVANVPTYAPNAVALPAEHLGTTFHFGGAGGPAGRFAARPNLRPTADAPGVFRHATHVDPAPRLYVVGTEYDATVLARLAAAQGWDAHLITHPRNRLAAISGVTVTPVDPPALLEHLHPDAQTAVVLMGHNYARDLAYLHALARAPALGYLGLLGPARRRDALLGELAETFTDWPAWLHDSVYGPAGLDLGAELPEQIALSIMAEVVAVFAGRPVPSLRDKRGTIHEPVTTA